MSGNGDVPYPRTNDPLVISREAYRLAWRADEHGIELHASVVRHLATTDEKVDGLTQEVREALRELREMRKAAPSAHDLEDAAKKVAGAAESLEEAVERTHPGFPRPPTDSERVRTAIAVREHARWMKLKDSVLASVAGGAVLAGLLELVRFFATGHW